MTRIKLELDTETFGRLVEAAVAERRPANWQAEVMLMRALGIQRYETSTFIVKDAPATAKDSQKGEEAHVSA
jgi:hypothetical protein